MGTLDAAQDKRRRVEAKDTESSNKKKIDPPESFETGAKKDWMPFKKMLIAFLCVQSSKQMGTPLAYVINNDDIMHLADANVGNELLQAILDAPLQGRAFNQDNFELFQILNMLMPTGKVQTIVNAFKSTQDGRATRQRILQFYESPESKIAVLPEADNTIEDTMYYSDRKRFTFEAYVMKFLQAYEIKEQYGEPVKNEKNKWEISSRTYQLSAWLKTEMI
jgi:hypothetical protein